MRKINRVPDGHARVLIAPGVEGGQRAGEVFGVDQAQSEDVGLLGELAGRGPGLLDNRRLLLCRGGGGFRGFLLLATGDKRRTENGNQAQGHELLHIPHLLFFSAPHCEK